MSGTPTLPTWHASMLYALLRCGEAYRRKYLEHEGAPPTTRLIRGSAVHRGVGAGLLMQKATQATAPPELMEDVAATEVDRARHGGATLTPDESAAGLGTTWGGLKDTAVRLAGGYARLVAPTVRPVAVERRLVVEGVLPGIRLAGTLDLVDEPADGSGAVIRDVKTSERAPRSDMADTSDQLTMYSVLRAADTQQPATRVGLDYVVIAKAGTVSHRRLSSVRGPADRAALLARITVAHKIVTAGLFQPAPRDAWYCSTKWCEFAPTCPYFAERAQAE